MKKFLIILVAILMCCSFSTEATAQRSKTKGFNYKAHSQRNSKAKKLNAKRFKASKGDYTKMKCSKKRSKRSKARRRR